MAVLNGLCNSGQTMFSGILNNSLKSLLEVMITDQQKSLSHVHIPEIPNFNQSESNSMSVSEFKMKNIILEGLESVMLQKLELDVCSMSTLLEFTIPALKIRTNYTLNGIIDGYPITGDGNMTVAITTLYIRDQTFSDCNMVIFSEDECRLSNRNKTLDISVGSVQVSVTGAQYKNLSQSEINQGINSFIEAYIKSDHNGLVEKITEMLVSYKSTLVDRMSPSKLLKELKDQLMSITVDLKKNTQPLNGNHIMHKYLSNYV